MRPTRPTSREGVSPKSGIRGWFGNLSQARKIATVTIAVAGGLVTVGTAIGMLFTVVVWLFPSLQRLPPSEEGGATLSNLDVIDTVTLEEYLERPGMPVKVPASEISQLSQERRQRLGSIIWFDLELKGFAGKSVSLKWSVFNTDTGKPVGGLTEQPAWPWKSVQPQHNVSKNQYETWVPFPRNNKGTFLVILEVYATIEGNEKRIDAEEVKVTTPAKEPQHPHSSQGSESPAVEITSAEWNEGNS